MKRIHGFAWHYEDFEVGDTIIKKTKGQLVLYQKKRHCF
jgi:hypothetical protein